MSRNCQIHVENRRRHANHTSATHQVVKIVTCFVSRDEEFILKLKTKWNWNHEKPLVASSSKCALYALDWRFRSWCYYTVWLLCDVAVRVAVYTNDVPDAYWYKLSSEAIIECSDFRLDSSDSFIICQFFWYHARHRRNKINWNTFQLWKMIQDDQWVDFTTKLRINGM